eukprot:291410_1
MGQVNECCAQLPLSPQESMQSKSTKFNKLCMEENIKKAHQKYGLKLKTYQPNTNALMSQSVTSDADLTDFEAEDDDDESNSNEVSISYSNSKSVTTPMPATPTNIQRYESCPYPSKMKHQYKLRTQPPTPSRSRHVSITYDPNFIIHEA